MEAARWPFEIARGPLIRTLRIRLAPDEHLVSVVMHHIVTDGWSMSILLREVLSLYPDFHGGLPSALPELPIQYADFASWQRGWLQGPALTEQLEYWKRQLAGAPEELELPLDRPRPAVETFRGGVRPFALPEDLTRDLTVLTRRQGATLAMTLLAGFQALLFRYSGQEDLTVGVAIAGRNRREIEDLIGFFVNTLVFRGDLTGAASFGTLLHRVRQVALEAYAHQDLPFEKLVEELHPARILRRHPLFQVMFGFETLEPRTLAMDGLIVSPVAAGGLDTGTSKFDLTVSVFAQGGALSGLFEYNAELLDATTVERMLGHFQSLLRSAVAYPEEPLFDLPLLGEAERQQLQEEWNATGSTYPADASLQDLFAAHVRRAPDATALTSADVYLSYGELDCRAHRLGHRLRGLGVGPEDPVGLCLERSCGLIVGMLGILKAGGAYVPLDPSYPAERLAFMLADTGLQVLVGEEEAVASLPPHAARVVLLSAGGDLVACSGDHGPLPADVRGGSLAYVMFTSGSTGRPKGVAVPHRGVVRLVCEAGYMEFCPDEVFLQLAPVTFDASTFEIWGPLLHGARLVLAPEVSVALADLGDLLDRHGITTLWLTTALFHLMADHQLARLRPLRRLLTGGEVMSPQHVRRVLAGLPETRLTVFYGPTENTTFTSYCPLRDPAAIGASVPLGRPIANTRIYLLDLQGQPVPVGVPGELCTGGEGLARGYLRRPELTAENFVPDPFSGERGSRLYRTGDLARYLAEGSIEFLGRVDHQVKLRGFRIEPGEIEARLREHPAVRDCVVTVREEPPGNRFLVAYVVQDPGELSLRAYLSEKLPDYMVPTAFVDLAALPLTSHGKIDRRRLPAPSLRTEPAESYVAPRTEVERALGGIWSALLGVAPIGVADDFFALGGHSLLATVAVSRIRTELGIELPLRAFFETPQLADLAARIEELSGSGSAALPAPPIVTVPRGEPLRLSFAQERLWFLDQLEPDSAAYNLPFAVGLDGRLDRPAFAAAWSEIVRRHEALRTTFAMGAEGPVQVVAPPSPSALPEVDLTGLGEELRRQEAQRLGEEEAERPFDLTRGPLLRVALLRLGGESFLVLVNQHHIISDGWSIGVLVQELGALYGAFVLGHPSPLPELPIQYPDYAAWQRGWLAAEVLDRQLAYWRGRLAGAPAPLELPADRPRPAVQSFRGGRLAVELPAESLRSLARRHGVTSFMALVAGATSLLSRLTGEEDLAIGSPIAGRGRTETENLIGFFVNTLVIRSDLSGNPSFRELIRRVRETSLAAFAHQELPFERLAAELNPER
ncbi:MAG TPA: amino acid adenylation domain-containing protein, partial [Thermoanaerobaculia bacterium]|nr:amino acid adenylation domain-containing protein [Thermoanaerobaculia bacterium]